MEHKSSFFLWLRFILRQRRKSHKNFYKFFIAPKKYFIILPITNLIDMILHLNPKQASLVRNDWEDREDLAGGGGAHRQGKLLMIYICNIHVLSHLLLNYIWKLHWNLHTIFVCQVNSFWFTYVIFHVLNDLLLIYICKLHWNLHTMFVCQVNSFWFIYEISMS